MHIKIDKEPYQIEESMSILDACRLHQIWIPTLCHHESITPFGSCFLCLVELPQDRRGVVPSCLTILEDGMEIITSSERLTSLRKSALELLLSDHLGDCLAPCQTAGCPANIDIQGFLALEKQGLYREAAALIREKAPLVNILGHICPKPCQDVCRRNAIDGAVQIGIQKRFIAEQEWSQGGPFLPKAGTPTGKSVGIIGGGPAGITAAYYLAIQGHEVHIYEKESKLGGMVRYGIPAYRLPEDVIDKELNSICQLLGIQLHTEFEIGQKTSFADLHSKHQAILIAHGAQQAMSLRVDGEDLPNVLSALDFLKDVRKGDIPKLGQKVMVIGGGHTAMDAARSARRFGAEVMVLYRRTAQEMPAVDEVTEAEAEGITFHFLSTPISFATNHNQLQAVCIKMELGAPDESGRRRPRPVENSEQCILVDTAILAIGQTPDFSWVPDQLLNEHGWFNADPNTLQFNAMPKVFTAGDCYHGADLVVTAVSTGRKAAVSMNQLLFKQEVTGESPLFSCTMGDWQDLPEDQFLPETKKPPVKFPRLSPEESIHSFDRIELSPPEKDLHTEANRCLSCGCHEVNHCQLKEISEKYDANPDQMLGEKREFFLDASHPDMIFEEHKCINCGACVRVCEEVKKFDIFGFTQRGFAARVKPQLGKPLAATPCDGCGKCAIVCPTAGVWDRRTDSLED